MRDSIVFYRSFYEAIKELPSDVQASVYAAIFEYSLNFNEVVLEGLPKTIFTLIKPQLDANKKKFENGKKGGRTNQKETETEPKPNLKESKTEPNENQIETKEEAKDNLTETKTEANANVNANVNDNVNVNENANVNASGEPEMNFGFLVPDMCRIWYEKFPHYTPENRKDLQAMGAIAAFIEKQDGLARCRDTLGKVADLVSKEPFWLNKALASIAHNIQEFYNKIKNPQNEQRVTADSVKLGTSAARIEAARNWGKGVT